MSRRHTFAKDNWSSVFLRLEELILARSGEDSFTEIYKLVVAKLSAESRGEVVGAGLSPGEQLTAVQRQLDAVHASWPDVFGPRPHRLSLESDLAGQCLELLNTVDLAHTSMEVFDAAFENLHSHTAKGAKGQFFTPRHVIDACVQVLAPRPGELIADTACGSGGFLIHALEYLLAKYPALTPSQVAREQLWGFDFDQRAVDCARALMIFASGSTSNIYRSDSLLQPSDALRLFQENEPASLPTIEMVMSSNVRKFRGFDMILTNPPFAGDVQDADLLSDYEISGTRNRIERDILFVERNIRLLRPGGRIAIVLPHNKVAGKSTVDVRTWMMRHLHVVGVLGLGRESFMPHTSQKAVIVFGVKRAKPGTPSSAEEIMFAISEASGKTSKGEWVARLGSDPSEPLWTRVDHDLADGVKSIRSHADNLGYAW